MTAFGTRRKKMRAIVAGRSCAGFRMAARRGLSTGVEGRRRKAFREGTRGGWVSGRRSMGICRGGGSRGGCIGGGNSRWTEDQDRDVVAASAVDGVFLA